MKPQLQSLTCELFRWKWVEIFDTQPLCRVPQTRVTMVILFSTRRSSAPTVRRRNGGRRWFQRTAVEGFWARCSWSSFRPRSGFCLLSTGLSFANRWRTFIIISFFLIILIFNYFFLTIYKSAACLLSVFFCFKWNKTDFKVIFWDILKTMFS